MSNQHHLAGKPAINPNAWRNAEKMLKRGAKWIHISKAPIYQYDKHGVPVFAGMSAGVTYRKNQTAQ